MKLVIYLSFATASISFTVTKAKLFLQLREWVKRRNCYLGELFSCGYCLGNWVAFGLVAIYQPKLFQYPLPLSIMGAEVDMWMKRNDPVFKRFDAGP